MRLLDMERRGGSGVFRLAKRPEAVDFEVALPLGIARKVERSLKSDPHAVRVSFKRRHWRDPRAWRFGTWGPMVPDLSETRAYLTFIPHGSPTRMSVGQAEALATLLSFALGGFEVDPWEEWSLGRTQYAVRQGDGGELELGRVWKCLRNSVGVACRLRDGDIRVFTPFNGFRLPSDLGEEWYKTNNLDAVRDYRNMKGAP